MTHDTSAACTKCKVMLKHTDIPIGTRSDYWDCADGCGQRFGPVAAQKLTTTLIAATEECERLRDALKFYAWCEGEQQDGLCRCTQTHTVARAALEGQA